MPYLSVIDAQKTVHDLRVAADQYDKHAATLDDDPRHYRMAQHFREQAADARRRADLLERQ